MRELVSTVTLEMMEKHTQSNILQESMDSGQNQNIQNVVQS